MLNLTIMKVNKEGLAKSIQNRFCKFQRVGKYINALLNRIANLIALGKDLRVLEAHSMNKIKMV